MAHILKILTRTLAAEYYRINSGFLLFFGTLVFGFMSEIEHKALAQFFVSDYSALLVPLIICVIYIFQVIHFNASHLKRSENSFLYNIVFLSPSTKFLTVTSLLILQSFPALGYGTFLIAIAAKFSRVGAMVAISVTLLFAVLYASLATLRRLRRPHRKNNPWYIQRMMDKFYVRPFLQYYVEWLLRSEPLMVGGTKILSTALLLGVCTLYQRGEYDMRLIAMSITASGIINMGLVFHLVDFEHRHIPWVKNLPLTIGGRFGRFLFVMFILVIPELVVLLDHYPLSFTPTQVVTVVFYLLSLLALFIGVLHIHSAPLEYFTKGSFWLFIMLTLLILFEIPVMLLTTINMASGFLLFRNYYYSLEKV